MSALPVVRGHSDSVIRARQAKLAADRAQRNLQSQVSPISSEVAAVSDFEKKQIDIAIRIADRNSSPKVAKTVCRILPKDKVEKAMRMGGLILNIQGFIKTLFNDVVNIFTDLKKKAPVGFLKFRTFFPIPFWVVDSIMSMYSIYDSVIHGHKAYKKQDKGGVYDHSLNVTSNTMNIAANSAILASTAYSIKGVAKPAAAAGTAAAGLGIIFFAIYTFSQALNLKRVYKALSSIKAVLIQSNAKPIDKYKAALTSIKQQLFLTAQEEAQIVSVAKNAEHKDLLIEMQLKRKFDILARRIGANLATQLQASLGKGELLLKLDSADLKVKEEACNEGTQLLHKYRSTLNRQLMVRILKVAAGALALIACSAALVTPPGAAIASAVLFGAFFLLQTYSWYVANKQKDEDVYKLIDFAIPTVKELMKPYVHSVKVVDENDVSKKLQAAKDRKSELMNFIMNTIQFNGGVMPVKPNFIELSAPVISAAVAS